jgi:hypothetical protein
MASPTTAKEEGTSAESDESTTLISAVATTEQTYGPSSELAPSNQPGKLMDYIWSI